MSAIDTVLSSLPLPWLDMLALSWFLHPVLMIAVTASVVYVLHQREFRSRTLQALLGE